VFFSFLDVQQAFDKVWHEGLKVYKLKSELPNQLYLVLESYLEEQYFQVNTEDALSDYYLIKAGMPQGSVIGPLLCLIYTADVPARDDTLIATLPDDTAILSSDADPAGASERLHHHFIILQNWLKKNGKSR
jgi:hypothetical protein